MNILPLSHKTQLVWGGGEQQLHIVKQLFSTLAKSYLHPGIFPKKILICSPLDKFIKILGQIHFTGRGEIATESGALHCAISHLLTYLVKQFLKRQIR